MVPQKTRAGGWHPRGQTGAGKGELGAGDYASCIRAAKYVEVKEVFGGKGMSGEGE